MTERNRAGVNVREPGPRIGYPGSPAGGAGR